MSDTKFTNLSPASSISATDILPIVPGAGGNAVKATVALLQQSLSGPYHNGSTAQVTTAYAADTYLAGSGVTIPAGALKVGSVYFCWFDMTKTGAGTATPIITVRLGTLGTTGDAAINTLTWAAGTAAADTGKFYVQVNFRTVGAAGTDYAFGELQHNLTTTGLSNNAATWNSQGSAGSGINTTAATILGLSFNGGASFSGTNNLVQAFVIL